MCVWNSNEEGASQGKAEDDNNGSRGVCLPLDFHHLCHGAHHAKPQAWPSWKIQGVPATRHAFSGFARRCGLSSINETLVSSPSASRIFDLFLFSLTKFLTSSIAPVGGNIRGIYRPRPAPTRVPPYPPILLCQDQAPPGSTCCQGVTTDEEHRQPAGQRACLAYWTSPAFRGRHVYDSKTANPTGLPPSPVRSLP